MEEEKVTEQQTEIPKRKRGRPRKIKMADDFVKEVTEDEQIKNALEKPFEKFEGCLVCGYRECKCLPEDMIEKEGD